MEQDKSRHAMLRRSVDQEIENKTNRSVRTLSSRSKRSSGNPAVKTSRECIGYGGGTFPQELLEQHEFKITFPPCDPVDIRVSKSMLILHVPEELRGQSLDLGDWITKVNGEPVSSRKDYNLKLRKFGRTRVNGKTEITFQVSRTVKAQKIENPSACSDIPQAVEISPGCDYFYAYLTLYPGSSLGVNIKSYASKIYVSSTDNGFKSLAMRTFLVGDAILQVDGFPVSTVKATSEKITNALKSKKYVRMVIERASSQAAVFKVKEALMAEKTIEMDPRMTDDVIEICMRQMTRMTEHPNEHANQSLMHTSERNKATSNKPVSFAEDSTETGIGMDPINPILLQKAPPRPGLNVCNKRRTRLPKTT